VWGARGYGRFTPNDTPALAMSEALLASRAEIVRPIFAFPGGRRFQFVDPSGNELACAKYD